MTYKSCTDHCQTQSYTCDSVISFSFVRFSNLHMSLSRFLFIYPINNMMTFHYTWKVICRFYCSEQSAVVVLGRVK